MAEQPINNNQSNNIEPSNIDPSNIDPSKDPANQTQPSQSPNRQSSNEPIFIWVQYEAEEVNNGYWQVYSELQLPHRLFSIFALSFSLAMGYLLLSPESPMSTANTIDELLQTQYLPRLFIAGIGIPSTCIAMVYLLLRRLSESSYRKRPNFHFPMMYLLYPTGIQVQFATGTGMIDWRQFSLVLECAESFCLASNVNDVFVLPKRCFNSVEEVDAVRKILSANSRNFKKTGKKFNDSSIVYEKKAISSVMIDGEQFPLPDMVPPVSSGIQIESSVSANSSSSSSSSSISSAAGSTNASSPGSTNTSSPASTSESTALSSLSESTDSNLIDKKTDSAASKVGLEVEVLYKSGEIAQAENIYFFRKRLVLLGMIYVSLALLMPINFLALGYIWNLPQATEVVLGLYQRFVLLLVPIYIGHAVTIYWNIMERTKINDEAAQVFVFQLGEEGCGVRTGERFVILAWWHFEECWETEDQLLLLLGSRGRTMFVVPKRAFTDRIGLAYATNLLQRKIKRYKALS